MSSMRFRWPPLMARWTWWLVACFALAAGGPSLAQDPAEADPPGRVARIAETFGQVWLYSPDAGEWISAVRNRPVTTGDRIATDHDARVELDLGTTTLRLDAGTELEVRQLDDAQVSVVLHEGSAALRVRDAQAAGEFELSTEEGRLSLLMPGRYRFDRIDRSTHLTVYAGQARFEGPGSALVVDAGQRGQFWLEANGTAQYSVVDPVRDAFAGWVDERERNEDRVATARYVSPEMPGARDLDRYGRWEQSPEYGAIWYPRVVASGWAPYQTGHWAWIRPWGWTWVDDAPWGFAPFHYGRWVYYRNAWCWAPGTYVRRPVYAPALVAWVGGAGTSLSVSIGGGPAVGWFPLGPREVYVPAYRVSPRYVRDVNYTHVRNIPNVNVIVGNPGYAQRDFANRKYPDAVTVVPAHVLANREPVAPSAARTRDLPAVRAIVDQPGRIVAMPTPPARIAPAPSPSPRGIEARPFRPPGDAERQGRFGRPGTGAEDGRRGSGPQPVPPAVAEGSRRGGVPIPSAGPAIPSNDPPRRDLDRAGSAERGADNGRRGAPPGAEPTMRAAPDDRRGRDRRDPNVSAQGLPDGRQQAPAAAQPPIAGRPPVVVAPRPEPVPQAAVPQIAPAMRSAPPQAMPPQPVPRQAMPQPAMPQQPDRIERRRERERPDGAGMRQAPRPEPAPQAVPAQPRIAPAAPPQAPQVQRAAPPPVAPAVRPAEAPRARPGPPEGRGEPNRGQGRPEGGNPRGREERP